MVVRSYVRFVGLVHVRVCTFRLAKKSGMSSQFLSSGVHGCIARRATSTRRQEGQPNGLASFLVKLCSLRGCPSLSSTPRAPSFLSLSGLFVFAEETAAHNVSVNKKRKPRERQTVYLIRPLTYLLPTPTSSASLGRDSLESPHNRRFLRIFLQTKK